ncbi:hypothetical protein [Neisseria meningitidis]|uniref:hypothetical protein n=1 Tax=Neisseria meningitidis TaxID=487 RepID=UPI0021AC5F5F|nr:hypothetical protein [Neisseria meningitidis]
MPSEAQILHFRRHFYSRLKSKIYTPVIPAQAGTVIPAQAGILSFPRRRESISSGFRFF